jgi:hypothetical protein
VNNREYIKADFKTLQEALDGTNSGDTLYVEPSSTSYGDLTLTKNRTLIGNGYFLDQNIEAQWNKLPSMLENVTFSEGSSGSQLIGFQCNVNININVSNIIIRRNYVTRDVILSQVTDPISKIILSENYFNRGFSMTGSFHDIIIKNNILILSQTEYGYPGDFYGTVDGNGIFMNNVIIGVFVPYVRGSILSLKNFYVQNNILTSCNVIFEACVLSNNIASDASFGDQNGNRQNIDLSTVFLYSGSADGQYQLKEGSPAIGAGYAGVDCGAFGGDTPYVLSGIPPIPAIYHFGIGSRNGQNIITLKVKSHK